MADYSGLAANLAAAIKASEARGEMGGTYALAGEEVRDFSPLDGLYCFAVGGAGEEYKVKRVTVRGLEAWIRRNVWEIMSAGHVGYWIHEGTVYLDVTTIWAGTDYELSREAAMKLGTDRGELAIWDFTAQEEIATSPALV